MTYITYPIRFICYRSKIEVRPTTICSTPMPYVYQKNADGLFVCGVCQVTKKNQNTMHYHLKTHEGHLPFECPTCKKEFLHAQTLALHVAARHTKEKAATLQCPYCPYKTLTKANRIIHFMRKHCGEETSRFATNGLVCPACDKECNSSTAFLYHIATNCMQLPTAKQAALDSIA